MEYEVVSGGKTIQIRVGGVVDRIDRTADGLRIVDYKTGRNLKLDFKEWSQLVDRNYYDRRKENISDTDLFRYFWNVQELKNQSIRLFMQN